jgi:sec-independent protein translocase protein TatA
MSFSLAFIDGIGGPELMMIMFIILLLFGANRLPELAKGLGKSVREFKKATSSVEAEVRRAMEEDPPAPRKQPPAAIQHTPSSPPVVVQPPLPPQHRAAPTPPPSTDGRPTSQPPSDLAD